MYKYDKDFLEYIYNEIKLNIPEGKTTKDLKFTGNSFDGPVIKITRVLFTEKDKCQYPLLNDIIVIIQDLDESGLIVHIYPGDLHTMMKLYVNKFHKDD